MPPYHSHVSFLWWHLLLYYMMIFAERQRLPFGPFDCGCHDCSLFSLGNAMGRSFNSTFFEYRQIFDFGVFKCFTWRKASPRYVPNTYAFPFRHFPLHGCIFLEWPSDVGSFMFLLYARELPTWTYLFAKSALMQSAPFYINSSGIFGLLMVMIFTFFFGEYFVKFLCFSDDVCSGCL